MHDLAVIIVSTNEGKWLPACLTTVYAQAGDISLDVVVADNHSTDGTAEVVEREFPAARVVSCENLGFSHANNRGLMSCDARYVLFLNPDTEIVEGTFADLVETLDARPEIGLAGVRHLTGDGELSPTIRRFPNVRRSFGQALGSERLGIPPSWAAERQLDLAVYGREVDCDWTTGAFLFARREALEGAGFLDERFFIYSEETDLCLRIKRSGWAVRHLPQMTIIHHAGKGGMSPKMQAQDTYSRMQYAHKHFSGPQRAAYWADARPWPRAALGDSRAPRSEPQAGRGPLPGDPHRSRPPSLRTAAGGLRAGAGGRARSGARRRTRDDNRLTPANQVQEEET